MNQPIGKSPHIAASIRYILEMNLDTLDAIWLDGEIDFAGVYKEDFMLQVEAYFKSVKRKGETRLSVKTGKCLGCFIDTCNPVNMFYSVKAKSYFNLVFLEREGSIYDITVCHLTNEVMPHGYMDKSFEFMDDQKTDFVPDDDYLSNTRTINRVLNEFESVPNWTIEAFELFAIKLSHLYETLKHDEIIGPSFKSVKFKNLLDFFACMRDRFRGMKELEVLVKKWKSILPLNDKLKRQDVLLEHADILSSISYDEVYVEGQTFYYLDETFGCRTQIVMLDDISAFQEVNELVMPHFIKLKNSLDRFFERNKLFEGDKNEEIWSDYRAMHDYRLWFLETKKKYGPMFRKAFGGNKN